MRLVDLTERRQQLTKLMYHGTSSEFQQSVLKQGLLADPPKRTYSGDEDDPGPMGYETFGGVYITDDMTKAQGAARDAVDKFGGVPMIVTVQYAVGSGNLDEDHVTGILGMLLRQSMDDFYEGQERGQFEEYGTFTEWESDNRESLISDLTGWAFNKMSGFGKPNQQTKQLLAKAFTYILDYVEEDIIYVANEMEELRHHDKYLEIINALMRSTNDNPFNMKNIQIDRNIGYRGKTKIVQIETQGKVVFKHPGQHVTF